MPTAPSASLLDALKLELEQFGKANDATVADRPRRMLNIPRETGEFLQVLVRAMAARRVLEIGTSNGYSTLWLSEAARAIGGAITTVERSEYKVRLASANFKRAGFASLIEIVQDDAGALLGRAGNTTFDLIFLDADRADYVEWWPELRRVLRPGGLLVVDNATSHAGEVAAFAAAVTADAAFTCSLVPVGNGEFLAVKSPA